MKYYILLISLLVISQMIQSVPKKHNRRLMKLRRKMKATQTVRSKKKHIHKLKQIMHHQKNIQNIDQNRQNEHISSSNKKSKIKRKILKRRMKKKNKSKKSNELETIVLQSEVCLEAKKGGQVQLPYRDTPLWGIQKLIFTHINGQITCVSDKAYIPHTNFGCATQNGGFGIIITKNQEKHESGYFAPNFKFDSKVQWTEKKSFYSVDGLREDNQSILQSDNIEIWLGQQLRKNSMDRNEGKTCFSISAQIDPSKNQVEGFRSKRIGENICVEAGEDIPQLLEPSRRDIIVNKVIFNHRKEQFQFNNDKNLKSNYGHKDFGYGILVTNNNDIFAPDFSNRKVVLPKIQINTFNIFWTVNNQLDSYRVEYPLNKLEVRAGQKLGVVYAAAKYKYKEKKLYGSSCFDVFIEYEFKDKTLEIPEPEFNEVVIGENICIEGTKGTQARLKYFDKQINGITKFKFTHKSGHIKCAPVHQWSNFGCKFADSYDEDKGSGGYSIWVTKSRNTIAPQEKYDTRYVGTGLTSTHKKDFYTLNGVGDSDAFELLTDPQVTSIQKSDVIEIWYKQVWLDYSMSNNSGKTCFDVSIEYDTKVSQEVEYDQHEIADNLCMQADNAEPVKIPQLWEDINIKRFIVNHRKGQIECENSDKNANFGCNNKGLSTLLLKDGAILGPDFNDDKAIKVVEQKGESKPIFWKINDQTDKFSFESPMEMITVLKTNKLSAVFAKSLYGKASGVKGETCFDVWVEYKKHATDLPDNNGRLVVIPQIPDTVIPDKPEDNCNKN